MAELSDSQRAVIELEGDVFVTACPGSGKTRVLTEKVVSTLETGIPPAQRIAAVTFTHRAADEIDVRLQQSTCSRRQVWTGTIHAFALEWILRPYSSYDDSLRMGFSVADEFRTRQHLDALKEKHGVPFLDQCRLGIDRNGDLLAKEPAERSLVEECREQLRAHKFIDFDCVLYLAFALLQRKPEIARTLAAIFHLICIDEYQDTQDLQFGILSSIIRNSGDKTRVFIVGDKNQAIYASLGGIAKTVQEIKDEFRRPNLKHRELTGNYRSTQRIVDFCANFCDGDGTPIQSLAKHATERGLVTFNNGDTHKDQLSTAIARTVKHHLDHGVKPEDICILGPAWWLVTALGRQLILHLPQLELDAPGLSPLRYQPDSLWFKLARLFLTDPTPSRYHARLRWAADFLANLETSIGRELCDEIRQPRAVLRIVNAMTSPEESGLAYLDDVFTQLFDAIELDITAYPDVLDARQSFFDGAEQRLIDRESQFEPVDNLKKMFRYPSGTVVNTCHGVKGEEFSVVICFGLLKGYVPHWARIYDPETDHGDEARRILYVVASRAKKCLHFFSETGRTTRNGRALETTEELSQVIGEYDQHPVQLHPYASSAERIC